MLDGRADFTCLQFTWLLCGSRSIIDGGSVGLNRLVRAGEHLMEPRNLAIVGLILVFGIGGMTFAVGKTTLEGIGPAATTGVFLNLVLPRRRT